MHDPSEAELDRLMMQLAQGERTAFEPLFRALYPRALRFARVRLGADGAADAAQSALTRVFARASEFTPGRPVLPWFYAIVTNEVRSLARERSPAKTATLEDPAALFRAEPQDPERLLLERELQEAFDRAVTSLDATSAETLGALLGDNARPAIDAPAFRKRVSRVYARLRVLVGGSDGE